MEKHPYEVSAKKTPRLDLGWCGMEWSKTQIQWTFTNNQRKAIFVTMFECLGYILTINFPILIFSPPPPKIGTPYLFNMGR